MGMCGKDIFTLKVLREIKDIGLKFFLPTIASFLQDILTAGGNKTVT